jgi:hypothetical protein
VFKECVVAVEFVVCKQLLKYVALELRWQVEQSAHIDAVHVDGEKSDSDGGVMCVRHVARQLAIFWVACESTKW